MAKDDNRVASAETAEEEETRSLLPQSSEQRDSIENASPPPTTSKPRSPIPFPPRRQSSFAQPRPPGTPRTPNRVRFDVEEPMLASQAANGHVDPNWMEDEDFMADTVGGDASIRHHGDIQRLPLLTDIEAPSVTVATADMGFNAEELLESARPKSGLRSAFMNMANSIIGAGIIGQPYALRQAGLVTGMLLLVALTVVVDWTIRLIIVNSKMSGANSFQATVEHCFGRPGLIAISIAQWAFAFGGMVAFCIIVGDTIPHVFVALFPSLPDTSFLWLFTDRRAIIVLFILGISFPLSLYRDIAKLAKASTLALVSMLVIIVTVLTQGPRVPSDMKGKLRGSILINNGVFQAIGVISFAFVCHHNSLLIYGSLKKPTLDRFTKVTHFSTGVSMVACMVMALAGYLTFGDKTQGNVLNNFPSNMVMVNVARFCFGLNMLTTLPLEAFVCREVMTNYYFPNEPFHPQRHLIFTTSLVVSAMALALLTCDLGAVFELIGATSACALAYILPPLCFLKLRSRRDWQTYVAWGTVVFGVCVLVVSIVLAVIKIVKHEGGVQTCS